MDVPYFDTRHFRQQLFASRIHKEAPAGNIADIVGATRGTTEVRPIGFWQGLFDRRPHLFRQWPANEIGYESQTLQHRAGFHCIRGGQQFLRIDLAKSAVHDAGELGRTAGEFGPVQTVDQGLTGVEIETVRP